jgi:transcriptional regulator with GAF, ATPase, and Fis domain
LSAGTPRTVGVVRDLAEIGFAVIIWHTELDAEPLASRCQLLLAGCRALVDGKPAGATDELKRVLVATLRAGLERADEERGLVETMRGLGIVGRSRAMLDVFRHVVRLAGLSDLPIVISGETGTGKELLARAFHALDPKRRTGPFIALNCAAINAPLAESELFGHRRGAFTGADRDRRGLIRAAHGGVLFLDEIAEMPAALQPKLLRVLQERRVLAVGDEREVPVSVRVIAATNRDLPGMVDDGRFRQDLFHRLNVLSIEVPPLRARREDIPPLVEHFTRKHQELASGRPASASPEFVEALSRLELQGNARELENLVRGALVHHAGSGVLTLGDLPSFVWTQVLQHDTNVVGPTGQSDPAAAPSSDFPPRTLATSGWGLSRSMHYCERTILEAALKEARGNQSRAARLLGITPRSVYNKVRRHRLA